MGYASQDKHFERLVEVADHSFERQRADRRIHQLLIRHLMGENHPARWNGEKSDGIPTSIPLLSMAYRAMSRHLISKAPRVLANVQPRELKSWVENQEIATNKRIIRSGVAAEARECANQSMTSFGTMFMGPEYVGTPEGMRLDMVIKAIDRADFFYDTEADWIEKADIQGHEFDMPLIDVREHPLFEECKSEVDADDTNTTLADSQSNMRKDSTRNRDLYDYVRIRFVYEKRRNKVYYYPKHQPNLKLLEMDWLGPRHGPYRFLYYEKFPGNATPMSPLMHLLKKHRSFNMLDVKSVHQQQVAKALLAYSNASKEEAKTILNSLDTQSVLHENGAIRWMHIGGASPDTVAMARQQRMDFSYAAGNLDQYMGLSSQAPTLGQERLLSGSANEMLEDMGGYAYQFIKGVCEDIFWFDLRDPDENPQMLYKQIPGREDYYAVEWTREHRRFVMGLDYDVDVEPYSYVERSPQSRLADVLAALQILMQFQAMGAAQGASIDFEAVVRTIAKYKNLPELYDVMILNQDPEKLSALLGPRTEASPVDTGSPKRYIRESRSDGSGADMEILRSMGRGSMNQEAVA